MSDRKNKYSFTITKVIIESLRHHQSLGENRKAGVHNVSGKNITNNGWNDTIVSWYDAVTRRYKW